MGLRWLAIGDSITNNVGASIVTKSYIHQTRQLLRTNGFQCSLINAGISGIRSDEALTKYKGNGGRCDPDLVTIMIGTNDVTQAVSTSTFQTNLQNLINDIKMRKSVGQCQIVLMTLIFRNDSNFSQNASFNAIINGVASANNIPVVDTSTAISSASDLSDTLHPNDSGHLKIANMLYPVLAGLDMWKNVPKR